MNPELRARASRILERAVGPQRSTEMLQVLDGTWLALGYPRTGVAEAYSKMAMLIAALLHNDAVQPTDVHNAHADLLDSWIAPEVIERGS